MGNGNGTVAYLAVEEVFSNTPANAADATIVTVVDILVGIIVP